MRNGHPYQAFYCEENIWQLALRLGCPAGHVLMLSNAAGGFAMWNQRASPEPELPVVWDYHVVYVRPGSGGWEVLDHDTWLPFGVPLAYWLAGSFVPLPPEVEIEEPLVRVIPAADYLARFGSDRAHMRDEDGGWVALPPSWDPLVGGDCTLKQLLDPGGSALGRVVELSALPAALERASAGL